MGVKLMPVIAPRKVREFFKSEMPPEVVEYFRQQGSRGGKIGGKKSLTTMTPEERKARAQKAATARWKKRAGSQKIS